MAKKKKKGGKGKGTKKEKLSHREREIYLIHIEDLRHKIEWRSHMCDILEEDMGLYRGAVDAERRDKERAVALLEDAVLEQKEACRKAEWALPFAEQSKAQAEERRGRELASKLVQANEEAITYEAELRMLRRQLKSLETYDVERVEQKIRNLEAQLRTEDEETLTKGREQDKRRVEAFRKEMFEILEDEAESFQGEVSGRVDEHLERISEETRWWLDAANGLRIATDRLSSLNDAQSSNLRSSDLGRDSSPAKQRHRTSATAVHQEEPQGAQNQTTPTEEERWLEMFRRIERNEEEIKSLEYQLQGENLFGRELSNFVARAVDILSFEARSSLEVTYDGRPVEKRTLSELRVLLQEAAQYIYDHKNRTSAL